MTRASPARKPHHGLSDHPPTVVTNEAGLNQAIQAADDAAAGSGPEVIELNFNYQSMTQPLTGIALKTGVSLTIEGIASGGTTLAGNGEQPCQRFLRRL